MNINWRSVYYDEDIPRDLQILVYSSKNPKKEVRLPVHSVIWASSSKFMKHLYMTRVNDCIKLQSWNETTIEDFIKCLYQIEMPEEPKLEETEILYALKRRMDVAVVAEVLGCPAIAQVAEDALRKLWKSSKDGVSESKMNPFKLWIRKTSIAGTICERLMTESKS